MSENVWEIVYQGKLIALERLSGKWYERAVRPPWVRLILKNNEGKILLTREHRMELDDFDYRLPGGKVFDDLESYLQVRWDEETLETKVIEAAKAEAKEECWIEELQDLKIIHTSKAWATVEWTLYYISWEIVTHSWQQALHGDELVHGIEVGFYTPSEIQTMIREGKMNEERSVAVLSRYIG